MCRVVVARENGFRKDFTKKKRKFKDVLFVYRYKMVKSDRYFHLRDMWMTV